MATRTRGLIKSLRRPEHQVLCNLLVQARHKAGLSQEILAKRLKRPQSFVAKYEGSERRLDVLEFIEIVRAVEADPVSILRLLLKRIG